MLKKKKEVTVNRHLGTYFAMWWDSDNKNKEKRRKYKGDLACHFLSSVNNVFSLAYLIFIQPFLITLFFHFRPYQIFAQSYSLIALIHFLLSIPSLTTFSFSIFLPSHTNRYLHLFTIPLFSYAYSFFAFLPSHSHSLSVCFQTTILSSNVRPSLLSPTARPTQRY